MGEDFPLELEKIMRSAGTRIMSDIIRRVRDCSEITRTADWQIDRLNQLGESKKHIKSTIQKALKLSDKQIEEMYKNAAESAHAYNKELYKATGKDYIPYAENAFLQQITAAVTSQTKDEFKNLTGSLGFAVKRGGQTVFKPIAKYYQSTLDNAVADITSGAFDYNTVIKRTVEEMTRSGLRTVDYASGHSNRIDVAVRRAVLTGLNQLTGQVQEANAEKLGAEKFEVTWHSTARPTHQPWQGRVYTKEELVSVCGLGEVDGLKGANCRHDYFPFIEGISERVYTDEQLEELNRKENEKKVYGDKEYTAYEATQRQRYLETAIRAQRQKIKLLQEGNASEDDIISAKCKYQKLSQEYTSFSKAMSLPQERNRIYSDGLGKVDVKLPKVKKQVASSENSGIIKAAEQPRYYDRVVPNPEAEFIVKIDGYNQAVNNGLSKACKIVADVGFKNDCEALRLVNLDTGIIEYEEMGTGESVGNESFWEFAGQNSNKRYAFVHNHNTMSGFSETDMRTLLSDNCIEMFVVSRADGTIMVVEKCKTPETLVFDRIYADELEQINKQSRMGEISLGERTFLREQIIVDNLIKEYTKGLIIFE